MKPYTGRSDGKEWQIGHIVGDGRDETVDGTVEVERAAGGDEKVVKRQVANPD